MECVFVSPRVLELLLLLIASKIPFVCVFRRSDPIECVFRLHYVDESFPSFPFVCKIPSRT